MKSTEIIFVYVFSICFVISVLLCIHLKKRNDELNKEIFELNNSNELLKDSLNRTTEACSFYLDGVEKAHAEKKEKINELKKVDCEWSNDALPESILQLFGICQSDSATNISNDAL